MKSRKYRFASASFLNFRLFREIKHADKNKTAENSGLSVA